MHQSDLPFVYSFGLFRDSFECGVDKEEGCKVGCNHSLYHNVSRADSFLMPMMSGPLVPQPSSAGFSQQGQVDWVELSTRSVQFSVAVLARLSRAGIDAYTLQVGRALCLNFALDPIAQEHIADAIFQLKKYSSYGNLIWFGFGVKHVVTDLAETEEGLTLVALCAALTTTYDSTYSARVVRELCVLQKAPQSFTPALRQWKAVVQLCSGILTSSHFILVLNGFWRLVSAQHKLPSTERYQHPTLYAELALAIYTLARISKRHLVNATITGGFDCAWLAAFAEWVLRLDVGIFDTSGRSLYRSRSCVGVLPQIKILIFDETTRDAQVHIRVSKAMVVSSGSPIILSQAKHKGTPQSGILNWRSPWSSILHDTFNVQAETLLSDDVGTQFALYLECASLVQISAMTRRGLSDANMIRMDAYENNPVDPLLHIHPDAHGRGFLKFASVRLPEIAASLWLDRPVAINEQEASRLRASSCIAIGRACTCSIHQHRPVGDIQTDFCLEVMAETILVFLWILLASSIDDGIYPSITGLTDLYSWFRQNHWPGYDQWRMRQFPVQGIDLVFHVLTGVPMPYKSELTTFERVPTQLAMADNSLCVYRTALEDPKLPLGLISKFRVVHGYIAYSGARFGSIRSLASAHSSLGDKLPGARLDYLLNASLPLSIDVIMQESDDEAQLEMAYLIKYIDANKMSCNIWLDLGFLMQRLGRVSNSVQCAGKCKRLYELESFPFADYPWRNSLNAPLKLNMEAVDVAQQTIRHLKDTKNTWILITTKGKSYGRHPNHASFLFIGESINLYLYLTNCVDNSWSLVPFIDCLTCMTERGYWARIYEVGIPNKRIPSRGDVNLVIPYKEVLSFKWETEGSEDKDVYLLSSVRAPANASASPNMDLRGSTEDPPSSPTESPEEYEE